MQFLKQIIFLLIIVLLANCVLGQSKKDTSEILNEIRQVMSFSDKPILYYEIETTINSEPVLNENDTLKVTGIVLKNGKQLYYQNGDDEVLVFDSIMFKISNKRKSIWILKLNEFQQQEISNALPGQIDLFNKFRENYIVEKELIPLTKQVKVIFYPKANNQTGIGTKTIIYYDSDKKLPLKLQMEIVLKEDATQDLMEMFAEEGINAKNMIEVENGKSIVIRKQLITIAIKNISFDKNSLMVMPSQYNYITSSYEAEEPEGAGNYSDYEIRKLF